MTMRDSRSGRADGSRATSEVPVRRVAAAQLDPSRADVQVVETHISTVVFDGDLVHKRKRPVRYPFVDLSTPARREATCRKEIELNRRFSPDVYLGLEEIVDDAGDVVDHAVLMRRMPADRRLSTLVRSGTDVHGWLRSIARIVASAHAAATRGPAIDAVATPDAVEALWRRSLDEMEAFVPRPLGRLTLDDVGRLAERYITGRVPLFVRRIERGLIVDGHGDLLADDIFCLDDGPRILDGLEFDDRLRWGDVIADVAFLAMDLERLGRPDLARAFLDWYREFSDETHPRSLADHYVAYRALVRAKVACLRPGGDREAKAHLAQCHRHLLDGRVRLLVVGGLPGTGKSTLARQVASALEWTVLRSDEIRKELAGVDPLQRSASSYREGLYTPMQSERTYDELFTRARQLLAAGESVILDASFSSRRWRTAAADVAEATRSDLVEVLCHVPSTVAASRMARRDRGRSDASDATPAVATRMSDDFDEWPTAIAVPTLLPADELARSLVARLHNG